MIRLLLIAPTLNCYDVGEAWVAYQWASRSLERHDVTILSYRKAGAPPIREQLRGARVVEWDEPPLLGRAERFNSLLKPGYVAFFLRARHWMRQAARAGERFDIAHQVAPVAMRYPSPVASAGLPYVIGPVGGSLDSPSAFRIEEGTNPWYTRLRALDSFRLCHDPLLRATYENAACVLGIAPYVERRLSPLRIKHFEVMAETAVTSLPAPTDRTRRSAPLSLLYVGRLIRSKGARDVIRAMAHLRDLPVKLHIVGDGPDRLDCQELCSTLGVSPAVAFHGQQPRNAVEQFYSRADIFVFPSYREPGGNVQFEAMAHGLPLIVSNRGGVAAAVDESCAILINPDTPSQYALNIARAIRQLALNPAERHAKGTAARERIARVGLWEPKLDAAGAIYRRILQTEQRP